METQCIAVDKDLKLLTLEEARAALVRASTASSAALTAKVMASLAFEKAVRAATEAEAAMAAVIKRQRGQA